MVLHHRGSWRERLRCKSPSSSQAWKKESLTSSSPPPFLPLPFSFIDASYTGRDLRSAIHVSPCLSPSLQPRLLVWLEKWQEMLSLRKIKLTPFRSPSFYPSLPFRSSFGPRYPIDCPEVVWVVDDQFKSVSFFLSHHCFLRRPQRASQDHLELTSLSFPPPSSFN